MVEVKINGRTISASQPTYFIAEIGSNFDKSISKAKDLIKLAKESGADAVKFQHYTAESLVSEQAFKSISNSSHQKNWNGSVFDIYRQAELDVEWTEELAITAREEEIDFFTSPYSFDLADKVEKHIAAIKIGSGEISWLEYLGFLAQKELPILLATGASTLKEVTAADAVLREHKTSYVLMQCNTNYENSPDNYSYQNLKVLVQFAKLFPDTVLGLSDHTKGHIVVLGAISLGARVIEKHFTDNDSLHGPDHPFSMTPQTWKEMISASRNLESALGDGDKKVEDNEIAARVVQRRSICAAKDLELGKIITRDDIVCLRPCPDDSYHPYELAEVLGRKLTRDIPKGAAITRDCLNKPQPNDE